jgi:RNA polymerase sigma-70 factor, ECF subfamily
MNRMPPFPDSLEPENEQPSDSTNDSTPSPEEQTDALAKMVYKELRQEAARFMARERPNHTLQATALANEAFIKMRKQRKVDVNDKDAFLKTASWTIRHILVDHARKKKAEKRGKGAPHFSLDGSEELAGNQKTDFLDLNDAIEKFARDHKRQAQVVELRFFGGLTVEKTAKVLKVSERTIIGDWRIAQAWLRRALAHENES